MRLSRKKLLLVGILQSLFFVLVVVWSLFYFNYNDTSKFANAVFYKIGLKEKKSYSSQKLFGMSWEEHWKLRQAEMSYVNKLFEDSKKTGKLEPDKLYTDFYPNYYNTAQE